MVNGHREAFVCGRTTLFGSGKGSSSRGPKEAVHRGLLNPKRRAFQSTDVHQPSTDSPPHGLPTRMWISWRSRLPTAGGQATNAPRRIANVEVRYELRYRADRQRLVSEE